MHSPMIRATLAATALASTSNVLAQFLEAYRDRQPFAFDLAKFLRFVILTLVTAPPNYQWQQLLERTFPAYERRGAQQAPAPAHDGDAEKQEMGLADRDHDDDDARVRAMAGGGGGGDDDGSRADAEAGAEAERSPRLNLRNTATKWFVDCITLGAVFNTVAFFVIMGLLKRQPLGQIGRNIRTETVPVIVAGYKIWPFASIVSFSCVPVEKRIVFLNFVGLIWGVYMSLVAARV